MRAIKMPSIKVICLMRKEPGGRRQGKRQNHQVAPWVASGLPKKIKIKKDTRSNWESFTVAPPLP